LAQRLSADLTTVEKTRAVRFLGSISQTNATSASKYSRTLRAISALVFPSLHPRAAVPQAGDVLAEMAQGHRVALLPVQAELTTQQAADLLRVSRPYLIRLLEDRKIPFRLVGQHRRVRFDDLLAYRRKDDEARRQLADELTADALALGMGY
jgi:excisionase family DNA binding protein